MHSNRNRIIIADNLELFQEIQHAEDEVSVLDINQTYHYVTPLQEQVLGYDKPHHTLSGKTNFDIQAPAVELAPQFHQECQRVINTQTSMLFFCSGEFANQETINYVYTMSPIQTPKGKPLGLIVRGERLNHHAEAMTAIQHLNNKMDKQGNYINFLLAPAYPGLTKRESQCLYWMLRGKSSPQIAKTLHLSPRTIESHFENIKIKYQCASKQELHDYCYQSGIVNILPTLP